MSSVVSSETSPNVEIPDFAPFDPAVAMAEIKKQQIKNLQKFRRSKQGKNLTAWVKEQHRVCKDNRVTEERQWALNMARYRGRDDLTLTPDDPRIPAQYRGRIARKPGSGRYRKNVNRVRPMIRTELARLISQKPSAYVIPATSEDADLFAAQAGEQTWESIQIRAKLQAHFAKAAFWTVVCGTGFMKVWWDPSAYDNDSELQGDIRFGAPTPFHIFVPDKMEQDIEDQPYVIHAFAKPVGWAKHKFKDELAGENLNATHARGSLIVENSVFGVVDNENASKDSVIIYEAWVKPGATDLLPNGGLVTVVNDIIVGYTEQYPYSHGQFPFVKFEHMPTETFYADSVIMDIAPLVEEYNETRSHINETIKKMTSLQLMAPQGAVIPQKITTEIGQVIQYKPGLGKLEPLPIQQLPGYVPQSLDRVLLDIEDISGQHQVSKGNAPSGVTAATAINFLQEKDESYFVHTTNSVELGMEKLGHMALSLAVQWWDEPRTVKTVGEDSAFDVRQLRAADLKAGTDLKIEGGSALPESKSAKQALIMDMMSQGFIPPQEGLKMLEIGGSRKIVDRLRIDERQAQRENLKLRQLTPELITQFQEAYMQQAQQIIGEAGAMPTGDPNPTGAGGPLTPMDPPGVVPVNSWDNHAVHIQVHNDFRKSQAFELLSPEVKAEFERHVAEHEAELIGQQIQQFTQGIPGDGTEPGGEGLDPSGLGDPNMMGGDPNAAPGGSEMPPEGGAPEGMM